MIPFVLMGFLIDPQAGPWPGLVLAILIYFVFWPLGDRFLLARLHAKDLTWNRSLKNKKNNDTYLLGLGHIELYQAPVMDRDVLVVQGALGRQVVVVGEELLKLLNQNQIDALILMALSRFKTKGPKALSFVAFLYSPYALFLMLSERLMGQGFFTSLIGFLVYPATLIHNSLITAIHREHGLHKFSFEGFPEAPHIGPTLYKLRLIQNDCEDQHYLQKYLKSFSLCLGGRATELNETQGMGIYGRQE